METQRLTDRPISRARIHIRLLGGFALALNGVPATSINSLRLQSLLAYLLLNRRTPQTRQHIAFIFWPDSSEAQAQSNLRNLLVALRRALPESDHYLLMDRQTIRWQDGEHLQLDVSEFESALAAAERDPNPIATLQRAVDLYMGDLLPGCYDEWIQPAREHLRESFQSALERVIGFYEQNGGLSTAILYAQRLLRQDPLLEENYRRLMRLYHANGDRAGVLNIYKQCARTLKRELGIEPGPGTVALAKQQISTVADRQQTIGDRQPSTANRAVSARLPAQTTIFFGRERELADVAGLLHRPDVRLVTLTGTAGTGKTRLGINIAASLANAFQDGIFFVPLAPVDDPGKVVTAIAATLELAESAGGSLLKSLRAHIADKSMLLLLDNFEHLLAATPVLAELLAACPHLKLLVTSRAILNLSGEHEYPVPPLPVPSHDIPPRPDEMLHYESVALFMDRAMEVSPRFALTLRNARTVSEICRRLEGLPLALELAAARVKVLSPEAILSRLDRRLKLLVGGRQDLPARQKALETAIAWSYNLLDEAERSLFRMLAVFSGGFTIEAVEAIFESGLEAIASLLNKSLLVLAQAQEEDEEEQRFWMLETLREYAWERLIESGQVEATQRLHALYFMDLAETAMLESNGPQQQEWLSRTGKEHDNLRAALHWAIEHGEVEIALRLAGALGIFWERRGFLTEGRRWLQQALALQPGGASRYRAIALYSCGKLALRQRDYPAAQALLEECRILYKELDDKEGLSNALSALAVMTEDKDYDRAIELHMESLSLRRQVGDKAGIARTLQNLGHVKMNQGRWSEASSLTEEAHAIYVEMGSPMTAYTYYVLAMIAANLNDLDLAQARFQECLQISRKMRNDWLTAWALQGLGSLLYRKREYEQANNAFAEAYPMFLELGDSLGAAHVMVGLGREALRTSSCEEANRLFDVALEKGRELDNIGLIGVSLAGLAGLAAYNGKARRAAMLFARAEAIFQQTSTNLEREQMTLGLDIAKAALTPDEWLAARSEGEEMSVDDAVSFALGGI